MQIVSRIWDYCSDGEGAIFGDGNGDEIVGMGWGWGRSRFNGRPLVQ